MPHDQFRAARLGRVLPRFVRILLDSPHIYECAEEARLQLRELESRISG
jgi:hypothetical protein